jgi:hypothetical protein
MNDGLMVLSQLKQQGYTRYSHRGAHDCTLRKEHTTYFGGTSASRVDESIHNRTSTELVVVEEGLEKELLGDMIRK